MRRGRCRYSQRVWSRANWGAVNDTADSWSSQGYDAVDGEYIDPFGWTLPSKTVLYRTVHDVVAGGRWSLEGAVR